MTLVDRADLDDLLAYATDDERELIEAACLLDAIEADYEAWLNLVAPIHVSAPLAEHHHDLWRWVWAIRAGVRPDPFVGIWPRGGAKSTSAELAVVALGARRIRRYGLYVCDTQDRADDHVNNIGALLESRGVELLYPEMGERLVGKYGNPKGWRVNRLRTASGFTVDAVGLDTASRGVKLEDQRPDFMVIDDVDGEHDSHATIAKRISTLTRGLIPAGAPDLAVLAIQNLVHPDGVFAQLADGRAEFLKRRTVSGPIPAVIDAVVDETDDGYRLTSGTPTWVGQDLEACQAQIDDWGISSWLAEAQHDVQVKPGGMFSHLTYRHCTFDEVPWDDILRVAVWVDPAVTDKDSSDSCAIQCDARTSDDRLFRLWSIEERMSPLEALKRAIEVALDYGAAKVGVETDNGGDTWQSVYREACALVEVAEGETMPGFDEDKAGAGHGGKVERASRMLAFYETNPGRVVHVIGTHDVLERGLFRFPKTKPYDLVDASYWSWADLFPEKAKPRLVFR